MTRRILIELALFALPFIGYSIFFLIRGETRPVSTWPLRALTGTGAFLAIAALALVAALSPSDHGYCYQAGHYENGRYAEGVKLPCDRVERPEAGGATTRTEN